MKQAPNAFTQTELDFGRGFVQTRFGHTEDDRHELACRLFHLDLIRDGLVKTDWIELSFIERDIERMVH